MANLLETPTPLLICAGEDDASMPVGLARRTYEKLLDFGHQRVNLEIIPDEGHQYGKYDVFAIMDSWLTSGGEHTSISLDETDRRYLENNQKKHQLMGKISAEGFENPDPEAVEDYFVNAKRLEMEDTESWFKLGLLLFSVGDMNNALYSFQQADQEVFPIRYAATVWQAHVYDIMGKRKQALKKYKIALDKYIGIPVQHDQWGIVLSKTWIEKRLETPFSLID